MSIPVQSIIINIAERENFSEIDKLIAIAICESRLIATDSHRNKDGSIDRGLFQISDKWHKEVSNDCAYSASCSTKEAIRIIKKRGFGEWACSRILHIK